MKLGDILKEARLKKGLSQTDVAHRLAITPAYYNRIENGKVKPPSWYLIGKLTTLLNLKRDEIVKLTEIALIQFKQQRLNRESKSLGLMSVIDLTTRKIPILSEVPTSTPAEYTDLDYPPGRAEDYYEFKVNDDNAFFLRAEGDCMSPYILKGDLLLICPVQEVKNGDVAAVVNNKGEKEVRRVSIVNNQVVLTANNPIYPTLIWGAKEKPKIIGRVKEIIRRR